MAASTIGRLGSSDAVDEPSSSSSEASSSRAPSSHDTRVHGGSTTSDTHGHHGTTTGHHGTTTTHVPEPSAWERLLAGGAAGAASRTMTAPIDRVKILFQVNATHHDARFRQFTASSAMHMGRRIVREEGMLALWRGCGASVTRILPYSATTFATFPMYNSALARVVGEPEGGGVATRFAAGALAGATATALTYPLDLLHARSAAHVTASTSLAPEMTCRDDVAGVGADVAGRRSGVAAGGVSRGGGGSGEKVGGGGRGAARALTPPPLGIGGSIRHLAATVQCGGVRSLYAGIGPTLMGIVPYGGISFAVFESIKGAYGRPGDDHREWEGDEMPLTHKLAAGAAAGLIAQTVTYPLHIVRRRMQVHGRCQYPSVLQGLRKIYAKEGVYNGLFKGVTLTWVKGPLAAAVGFTANDALKLYVPAAMRAMLASPPSPTPATYIEAKQSTAIESLIAGGTAGAVAKTAIAPADRVKIIYQVDPKRPFTLGSALRTARNIVTHEGMTGLWRGNGAMMARVIPYAGISFLSYPRYEAAVKNAAVSIFGTSDGSGGGDDEALRADGGVRIAARFLAGSAAGATATAITYPLDLLRARYAAQRTTGVSGSLGTGGGVAGSSMLSDMARILRSEGIRGLYGGITPTLIGIIPYAGISFATFETLKSSYAANQRSAALSRGEAFDPDNAAPMPVATRLLFGGLAGLFAQSVTYPLDIVRRRIQVVGKKGGYTSLSRALVDIGRKEGLVRGLYKGMSMNWVKGPVSVGVSFFVNDTIKNFFRDLHEKHYL